MERALVREAKHEGDLLDVELAFAEVPRPEAGPRASHADIGFEPERPLTTQESSVNA